MSRRQPRLDVRRGEVDVVVHVDAASVRPEQEQHRIGQGLGRIAGNRARREPRRIDHVDPEEIDVPEQRVDVEGEVAVDRGQRPRADGGLGGRRQVAGIADLEPRHGVDRREGQCCARNDGAGKPAQEASHGAFPPVIDAVTKACGERRQAASRTHVEVHNAASQVLRPAGDMLSNQRPGSARRGRTAPL
jgi:hypothetical protein